MAWRAPEWDRDMKYPAVEKIRYAEVITPSLGYVIDDKNASKPMSAIRVAATLRELERASPTLLLKALDAKSGLKAAGNQKLGAKTMRAVSFTDGGTNFTVLIDPQSKLPAAIRTRDDDNISGNSTYDLVSSDWKTVGGVKVAHTLSYQLNGVEVGKITYKEVTANPTIAADTFAVPEAVIRGKGAGDRQRAVSMGAPSAYARPLYGRRRHHRSTRRQPQAGRTRAQRAARARRYRQQPDRRDEGPSGRVRRALWRAAIALGHRRGEEEISGQADPLSGAHPSSHGPHRRHPHLHGRGATVIVPTPDKAYFEKVARMPHTVAPDELAKKRRARGQGAGGEGPTVAQGRQRKRFVSTTSPIRTSMA